MYEEKILNSWDLYLESMKQITYMSAQHKVYLKSTITQWEVGLLTLTIITGGETGGES